MQNITFNVEGSDADSRLDVILTKHADEFTRSYIQRLIKSKRVTVNDKIITRPSFKVKDSDTISLDIPPPQKIRVGEENIPINILYEDEDIAIIDKPKGMTVHPAPGNYSGTLVNAILYHFTKLSSIAGILRPGIVHRLDKDTSGLLVIAKTDIAHESLAKQFKDREVERIYWAIVERNIDRDVGTIDTYIARHPIDRKKMTVVGPDSGRRAITYFKVIERFQNHTLVQLKLETGRTHQIRVHMAHIGNPIVGDTVYGPGKQKIRTKGQALHAKKLGFTHPITKEYIEFEGDLPGYFTKLMETVRNLK